MTADILAIKELNPAQQSASMDRKNSYADAARKGTRPSDRANNLVAPTNNNKPPCDVEFSAHRGYSQASMQVNVPARTYTQDNAQVSAPARGNWLSNNRSPPRGSAPRHRGRQDTRQYGELERKPGFIGPCYTCQAVGHRASECPEIVCSWCRQRGHVMRICVARLNDSCQKCGMPGVNEQTCAGAHPGIQIRETRPAGDEINLAPRVDKLVINAVEKK